MRVIDLFCGCGGLGLGARRAGLDVALSVDVDPVLTSSHALNFGDRRMRLADVAEISGIDLVRAADGRVDGLVGGPPCQGFSEVGLANPDDPRRMLLHHFFRLVQEIRPRFFLMENVRGLAFEKNRGTLEAALDQVRCSYKIIGPVRLDSADFGAATRRPRVFVLGFDVRYVDPLTIADIEAAKAKPATVRSAIADLVGSRSRGDDVRGFDVWTYPRGRPGAYARGMRNPTGSFTGQRTILHRPEVALRFASVLPGSIDRVGRHPRLAWEGQCPTIRAGTGADRGSFQAVRPLHPDQNRVITVREAARLQGFPDGFLFHPTTWHSFRMIGNSVSPIMSKALLSLVAARAEAARPLQAAE